MALRLPSFRRRPESTHPRHRSITGAIQALLLAGFVILTAAACGEVGARPNNQGNEAYEQEDYEAAQSSYQEAIEKSPELPEPHYNSGNVRYRQGQSEEAQESYDRALLEAGEDLSRDILFNQGNIQLQADEIEEAIGSYKEVLRLDPSDQDAKHNLEVALSRLPQVEQQQQQGGQQQGDQQQQQEGQQQEGQQQQDGDQQDDSQQQQDGEEQGDQQQPQDPGSGGTQQDQQPGSQQPQQQQTTPTTELTPEQARQLLSGVGDQTDTLQNQLQRQSAVGRQPEQDW